MVQAGRQAEVRELRKRLGEAPPSTSWWPFGSAQRGGETAKSPCSSSVPPGAAFQRSKVDKKENTDLSFPSFDISSDSPLIFSSNFFPHSASSQKKEQEHGNCTNVRLTGCRDPPNSGHTEPIPCSAVPPASNHQKKKKKKSHKNEEHSAPDAGPHLDVDEKRRSDGTVACGGGARAGVGPAHSGGKA